MKLGIAMLVVGLSCIIYGVGGLMSHQEMWTSLGAGLLGFGVALLIAGVIRMSAKQK